MARTISADTLTVTTATQQQTDIDTAADRQRYSSRQTATQQHTDNDTAALIPGSQLVHSALALSELHGDPVLLLVQGPKLHLQHVAMYGYLTSTFLHTKKKQKIEK